MVKHVPWFCFCSCTVWSLYCCDSSELAVLYLDTLTCFTFQNWLHSCRINTHDEVLSSHVCLLGRQGALNSVGALPWPPRSPWVHRDLSVSVFAISSYTLCCIWSPLSSLSCLAGSCVSFGFSTDNWGFLHNFGLVRVHSSFLDTQ